MEYPTSRFQPYGVMGQSGRVSQEIQADQAALMHRARLCQELAAAESAEAAAAERLAADDRAAAAATQQANDRARRADIAKNNYQAALAELQNREANAKATAAAAAEAKAMYERALANYNQAEAEMKSEVAGAEEAAAICANAQRNLQNSVSTEAQCAQVLNSLEQDTALPRYGQAAGYGAYTGARALTASAHSTSLSQSRW